MRLCKEEALLLCKVNIGHFEGYSYYLTLCFNFKICRVALHCPWSGGPPDAEIDYNCVNAKPKRPNIHDSLVIK